MTFRTGQRAVASLMTFALVACGSDVTMPVMDEGDLFSGGGSAGAFLAAPVQTCHTVDFEEFAHGDLINSLAIPLAGGFNLTVSGADTRAYDSSADHADGDDDLQAPPNGLCAGCAGRMMVIANAGGFDTGGDSPDGGTIQLTGFPAVGETTIKSFTAVDQDAGTDPVPETSIELYIDGGLAGASSGLGDASVETVAATETPITGNAEFLLSGSGAIDNVEICHTPPPPTNPGTGTIGFWKTHPDAWPVETITVGGVLYSKDDAIDWMDTASRGDKSIDLFKQLVAAKLNVLIGNDPSCIQDTIDSADAWLALHGFPGGIRGNSSEWQTAASGWHGMLTDYNEGNLCAPHRD